MPYDTDQLITIDEISLEDAVQENLDGYIAPQQLPLANLFVRLAIGLSLAAMPLQTRAMEADQTAIQNMLERNIQTITDAYNLAQTKEVNELFADVAAGKRSLPDNFTFPAGCHAPGSSSFSSAACAVCLTDNDEDRENSIIMVRAFERLKRLTERASLKSRLNMEPYKRAARYIAECFPDGLTTSIPAVITTPLNLGD